LSDLQMNYKLPAGQVIRIGVERFHCSEMLFKLMLIDKESEASTRLRVCVWTFDTTRTPARCYAAAPPRR